MPRLRSPLAVVASVAIATSRLIYGSSIAAQACPLTDGNTNLSQTIRMDGNDRLGIANRPSDSKRQSLDYMGIAGFGAVAGLFAIALLFKLRRSRMAAPAEAEFLNRHPQFEHPELVLTLIPQEALPSTFATDFSLR